MAAFAVGLSRPHQPCPSLWPPCSCPAWQLLTRVVHVDLDQLNAGHFVFVDADAPGAVTQVSCGQVARDQWATIVDPDTARELADGEVGEIWLHGANIGAGYWEKDDETEKTFNSRLVTRLAENSHATGVADGAKWMSTGDYGVWVDGELYITGRVKDLVIVDGRNHYPQDLEYTAQEASSALRPGYVAAFAVPVNQLPSVVFGFAAGGLAYDPDDASEQLVIVAERGPGKRTDPRGGRRHGARTRWPRVTA